LAGTYWPRTYWLLVGLCSGGVLLVAAAACLFYLAPRHAVRHGVTVHLLVGLYGVTISCFDRGRLFRLLGTSYEREMEKWYVLLYQPHVLTLTHTLTHTLTLTLTLTRYVLYQPDAPSGCGGYVIPAGNRTDALRTMEAGAERQVRGRVKG
jgi:hypothetical protein